MTTSESRDFSMTRDDIISSALRKVGAISHGVVPDDDMVAAASTALNMMVQEWQNDDIFLWTQADDWESVVATTGDYILASDIIEVNDVYYRDSSDNDTMLTPMIKEEYDNISDKDQSGTPSHYYIHYGLDYPTLYVWPLLTTATGTIRYRKTLRLQDFDDAGNTPDFSSRWYGALVYGLAAELSDEYELSEQAINRIFTKASDKKDRAKGSNSESLAIQFSPRMR